MIVRGIINAGLVVLVCGSLGYVGGLLTRDKLMVEEQEAAEFSAVPIDGDVNGIETDNRGTSVLALADRNPFAALARLEGEIDPGEELAYNDIYFAMFTAWALRDPEAAIAAVDRIKFGPKRAAMRAVMDAVHSIDPERGGELLVEWRFKTSDFPSWISEHPEQACRLHERLRGSPSSDDLAMNAARWWGEKDPEAAFAWAQTVRGHNSKQIVGKVLAAWAAKDLEGAIAAYDSDRFVDPGLRQAFAQGIAKAWAKKEPEEAIEWLAEPGSFNSTGNLIRQWAYQDADAAIEWTQKQAGTPRGRLAFECLGEKWAETDPRGAAAFVVDSNLVMRTDKSLIATISTNYAKVDPVAALDWVDELPAGVRVPTERKMFAQLVRDDVELAVAEFGDRVMRLSPSTVAQFSAEYFKLDVDAARDWLGTLPRGLAYDHAVRGVSIASQEAGHEALAELARGLEAAEF